MRIRWRGFELPTKVVCDEATKTDRYAKFVIEPFERGFGTTIGNSLRRVLLFSLEGAAVTSVKFEGVLHEFSTVEGVFEDAADVILNLKQLRIRMQGDKPTILRIDVKKKGDVTGADVVCDADVDVVNKDLHLATLTKVVHFQCEIAAEKGRGYRTAEENEKEGLEVGRIPVDSIFTPVRNVGFRVEPTRVGHLTDFDRLVLEVTTNGTINPADAISDAAKILDRYLILFFDFQQQEEELAGAPEMESTIARQLQTRVEDLDFSVRTSNCLRREGITTVGELVQRTEADLMAIRNFGRKSLQEVKDKLATMDLKLASGGEVPSGEGEDEEEEESEE